MAKTLKTEQIRSLVENVVRQALTEAFYEEDENAVSPEQIKAQFDNMRSHILDMSEYGGGVIGVDYDPQTNMMIAGGISNAGMNREFELEYDADFSLDQNLQNFHEHIIDNLMQHQFESTLHDKILEGVMAEIKKKFND